MNLFTALVPIKKESQRLPGKNFLPFNGRPLWTWVLEKLEQIPEIDEVLVNTDVEFSSEQMKPFPKVRILVRPDHLLPQTIGGNELAEYDITQTDSEWFIQTHCTNPLTTRSTLRRAIQIYLGHLTDHDSLYTVTRHQARFYTPDREPLNHDPSVILRTQDLPPVFEDNGAAFVFSRKSFNEAKGRIGLRPYTLELSKIEALDIDDRDDFRIAEAVARSITAESSSTTREGC